MTFDELFAEHNLTPDERTALVAHLAAVRSTATVRALTANVSAERTVQRLTEWLVGVGLLHYHDHCTRPDRTHGPAWVLRAPATILGDSCEAWSPKTAEACIAAFVGPNV
jgi:hypothetical protein